MEAQKLNIVMAGIGHAHASGIMYELLAQQQIFSVLGYIETDPAILKERKNQLPFSHLTLLSEEDVLAGKYQIDAVVIETTMDKLLKKAQDYLPLKVAIHLDKPTGWDNGFIDLLDEAESVNVPIQMGYMYRYNPAVCMADNFIKNGKIGAICRMDAFMDTELSVSERARLANYPGGSMYVYGCHMLDMVLRWMGKPMTVNSFIKQSGFDGKQYDDTSLAVLEYKRGTAVVRAGCADANGYGRRQIVIAGEKGTIEIKPMEDPNHFIRMTYAARDGKNIYQDKAEEVVLPAYDKNRRYKYMLEDFAHMIRRETSQMRFVMDYEYEKALHELLQQAICIKR